MRLFFGKSHAPVNRKPTPRFGKKGDEYPEKVDIDEKNRLRIDDSFSRNTEMRTAGLLRLVEVAAILITGLAALVAAVAALF